MGPCLCAICGVRATMLFGGFNFCGRHTKLAILERRKARQLSFGDLKAIHATGRMDEDGDVHHDKDPLVKRWVVDALLQRKAG